MILESIKLNNFRQFREEYIEFAKGDNGKNVTIIIGENGTGKTTFAQAFFWCMYGVTSFSDKIILNKIVASELTPNEEAEVEVALQLRHGEIEYTLIRKQIYRKDYNNRVSGDNTVFDIQKKDATGNVSWVKKTLLDGEVNGILPKELSKFFFFDGERIENMSKDIASGKKSSDFSEAVQGLLGLKGMRSALDHFNPSRKGCVIGGYESSFDTNSDAKLQEYLKSIERCKDQKEKINARLEELNDQIAAATTRKNDKSEEIKQYEEGEKLQCEKESLQKRINSTQNIRVKLYQKICGEFNVDMNSFFSVAMVKRALELIVQEDYSGVDIPHMEGDTIEYLLRRKICICGTHLDEGSMPYNEVKKLIDVLPPKTLSTMVSTFKRDAKSRVVHNHDLLGTVKDDIASISNENDDITNLNNEFLAVDKQLSGGNVRDKVHTINNEIHACEQEITKDNAEINRLNRELGGCDKELENASTKRDQLALLDDNNKKISLYLAYARRVYEEIDSEYSKSEKEVRDRLQDTINDIFKQIYEGGLSLTIDPQYHISVYANNYEGDVETSTAQSIAVIFAFITGIIKLARENRNSTDEDAKLLSSEPYPLVMDAPLSTFDKRRIKTVCTALPETAEQVIIFIKDTDGNLAEEYMGNRIGSRHQFEKINEFETKLQ